VDPAAPSLAALRLVVHLLGVGRGNVEGVCALPVVAGKNRAHSVVWVRTSKETLVAILVVAPRKNLYVPQGLSVAACVLVLAKVIALGKFDMWGIICASNQPESNRGNSTPTRPMRRECHLDGARGDHGAPRGH
jgi:hypothetical protein